MIPGGYPGFFFLLSWLSYTNVDGISEGSVVQLGCYQHYTDMNGVKDLSGALVQFGSAINIGTNQWKGLWCSNTV